MFCLKYYCKVVSVCSAMLFFISPGGVMAENGKNDCPNQLVHATYIGHWPNSSVDFFTKKNNLYNVVNIVDPTFKIGDGNIFSRPPAEVMETLVNNRNHTGNEAEIPNLIKQLHRNGTIALLSLPGSKNFLNIVKTEESRKCFVHAAVAFMRKHNYDGIAIDWEHSLEPILDQHYLLMRDLRLEMDKTAGENASKTYLTTALHPYVTVKYSPELARLLCREIDWIDLMTYDMDTYAVERHNAPFKMIRKFLARMKEIGFPPNKICVGFASYGFLFRNIRPGDPANPKEDKQYIRWTKIVTAEASGNWKKTFDNESDAYYYYSVNGKDFITTDNPEIIARKTDYVVKEGFRGVFWWEFSYDLSDGTQHLAEPVAAKLNAPCLIEPAK